MLLFTIYSSEEALILHIATYFELHITRSHDKT